MKEAIILDNNLRVKDTVQNPPKGRSLSFRDKVTFIFIAILIIFISIYAYNYLLIIRIDDPPPTSEMIIAEVGQGDGNMTSGALFWLIKGPGEGVNLENYHILVSKKGFTPITLKWPNDYNSTYFPHHDFIDEKWWDAAMCIAFDAPPELQAQNIVDGDTIRISIVNILNWDIVFQDEFVYHD